MENSKKALTLEETKKAISKRVAEFEKRLHKAKNDFEIWCIIQEMNDVCQAEIDHWLLQIASDKPPFETPITPLIEEASKHISELTALVQKFADFQATIRANALAIQRAMINSHELKEPVILEIVP